MRIRNSVRAGITYSLFYEEYDACIAAGLDVEKWEYGLYSRDFKERIIAWHQLSSLITAHSSDAEIEQSKKNAKKAKRKK